MTISRKEQIMNLVNELTLSYLKQMDYTFDLCNAHDIAITLKLDRSNVSRLLNNMYKEFKLIKIKGRPTFYISKEVLEKDFKYTSIPHLIDSRENLEMLFRQSTVNKVINVKANFEIVGNRPGDSLYPIINLIVPSVAFKRTGTTLVVLNGNNGSGRQYFAMKMHEFSKNNKKAHRNSRIHYSTASNLINKGVEITDIENVDMFIIDIQQDFKKEQINIILDDISSMYMNKEIPYPIIVLKTSLLDKIEKKYYSSLTPYYVDFPDYYQRPSKEIIHIIVNEFQKWADSLAIRLLVKNEVILRFALANYELGFKQIIGEINALLSRVAFMSRNVNTRMLLISSDMLQSEVFDSIREDHHFVEQTKHIVLIIFPEVLEFSPNSVPEEVETLNSFNRLDEIFKDIPKRNILQEVKYEIMTCSTDVTYKFSENNSRLVLLLNYLFDNSNVKNDVAVIDNLYTILKRMIEGTFVTNFSNEDIVIKESKTSRSISDRIIDIVENKYEYTLNSINKIYIKNYIYYMFEMTPSHRISLLTLNNQSGIGENYAYSINQGMNSRICFSLTYDDSTQQLKSNEFNKRLSAGISKTNRGKGVVIFSDKKLPIRQEELIFVTTGIPTVSLYNSNSLLLFELARQIDNSAINLTSLLFNVVRSKPKINLFLTSNMTKIALTDHLKILNEPVSAQIFPNINISNISDLLIEVAFEITYELDIQTNNSIIVQLVFNILHMLERYKAKIPLKFNNLEEFKQKNLKVFEGIVRVLQKQNEFLIISFAEEEIATLASSVINHTSNANEINVLT